MLKLVIFVLSLLLSTGAYENYITGTFHLHYFHDCATIIGSYEEYYKIWKDDWDPPDYDKSQENEDQIKDCEIYVNGKKINFTYKYECQEKNPGNYTYNIVYKFNKPLVNAGFLFYMSDLYSLDFSHFDSSHLMDMKQMFSISSKLHFVNFKNFNAENVVNMYEMFYSCWRLTSVDLTNFKTKNLIEMRGMFCSCESLTSIDLSSINTSNVKRMDFLFSSCKSLKFLNLANFDTSEVTSMSSMFHDCKSLTSLDVSNFRTEKLKSIINMFRNCKSLTSLDLSSFNTKNVEDMDIAFCGCENLEYLDLSNFDSRKVVSMRNMFEDDKNLLNLNLSSFTVGPNLKDISKMFKNCEALKLIDLSNFDLSLVKDKGLYNYNMFENCHAKVISKN